MNAHSPCPLSYGQVPQNHSSVLGDPTQAALSLRGIALLLSH